MTKQTIKLSKDFRSGLRKTVASISLFAVTYIIIIILATVLTALCVYGGIMLIVAFPRFITLILGAGLASLGILVLIFLLKFIFQSHKVDRSHLQEITEADEPELFRMIREIVAEVDTSFPKKVYWSYDVNASVFYDSSFWSMFLPVKKNLQIGLGLVNSVSAEELKAILAHEFGHFSQRTMKVGSYVYNVNHVIFNMLYNNESYGNLVERWAGVHSFFAIFIIIAVKINQGIQWLLKIMYKVINVNYMGLSREMEFHADEIAAHVTGYTPLKSSLLRLDLAQYAYDSVLNYYNGHPNACSRNIYPEQTFVMELLAKESSIPLENGLPQVTLDDHNRLNKSKLHVKDQWASHPSIEERISRLESLDTTKEQSDYHPATDILNNAGKTQEQITGRIFSMATPTGEPTYISLKDFKAGYEKQRSGDTFDKVYNGYYDHRNPVPFDLDGIQGDGSIRLPDLFSQEKVDLVYTSIALQNDIQALSSIADKSFKIRTFDYDGRKYKQSESRALLVKLKPEQDDINNRLKDNDVLIYRFFKAKDKDGRLEYLYRDFFLYDKVYDEKYKIYAQLADDTRFMYETTPYDTIRQKLKKVKAKEIGFKESFDEIINDERYQTELTPEVKEQLASYISSDLNYFGSQIYYEKELEILFTAMNEYLRLIGRGYFLTKKKLLDYQVELLHEVL